MASITFPTIQKPSMPFEPDDDDIVIRSQFDKGPELTRSRFTKIRQIYNLKWNAMSDADHTSFYNFWKTTAVGGTLAFNWTNPLTSVTGEFRFAAVPKRTMISNGFWEVSCQIREV